VPVVVGVVLVHPCAFVELCHVPSSHASHTRSLVAVAFSETYSPGKQSVNGAHARSEVEVGAAVSNAVALLHSI
jgi:hypothetical protein